MDKVPVYSYSGFCHICQNSYNSHKYLALIICKQKHVICRSCAINIIQTSSLCPFCRSPFLNELKLQLQPQPSSHNIGQRQHLIRRNQEQLQSSSKEKIIFRCLVLIIVCGILLIGFWLGFRKVSNCEQWGNYNKTCQSFGTFYCCNQVDEQCPNNLVKECDYLILMSILIDIFAYGGLVLLFTLIFGFWILAKELCKQNNH